MPALDYTPTGALGLSFKLTELAGEDLYSDDSGTVTAPSGFDAFKNIRDLCHNHAALSGKDLSSLCNAALAAEPLAGTITVSIDSSDKVSFSYDGGSFSVKASSASNPWGLTTSYTVATVTGGVGVAAAPNNWTRGTFTGGNGQIVIKVGTHIMTVSLDSGTHQGVIESIRDSSVDDGLTGAVTTNLSTVDTAARFLLNDSGYVEIWRDNARGDLVWISSQLQDLLGFTGDETATDTGTDLVLVASEHPRMMLWIDRPIEYVEPLARGTRRQSKASDGRREIAHLLTERGWTIRFSTLGLASNGDQTADALDSFFLYLWEAEYVTVYQNIYEPRLAAPSRSGYSVELCGEDDYRVGALQLVLDESYTDAAFTPEEPSYRYKYYFEFFGWEWVE